MALQIDYVEFGASDLEEIKRFYSAAFAWTFVDYGPTYCSFEGAGVDGGFTTEAPAAAEGVLVVLFADDLEDCQARVEAAGGKIVDPIFSFPGGRRFHFRDPSGNRLGVWGHEPERTQGTTREM